MAQGATANLFVLVFALRLCKFEDCHGQLPGTRCPYCGTSVCTWPLLTQACTETTASYIVPLKACRIPPAQSQQTPSV